MKQLLTLIACALLLAACSGQDGPTQIEGRILNMNQAQFLVYSPDGAITGIDTIKVQGGRFSYKPRVAHHGTLLVVLPNYALMPVFVEPGADISIEGDAAQMKRVKITGTDDNKRFTEWRLNADKLSPPEMKQHATRFIEDNPASIISVQLLRQHYILAANPDLKTATTLARKMLKAMRQADDATLAATVQRILTDIDRISTLAIGQPLPRFSAKDINGKPVLAGPLLKGKTVIVAWTSWSEESKSGIRQIVSNRTYGSDEEKKKIDNVLSICLDPSLAQCRATVKNLKAEDLTTVCDTTLFQSQLTKALGITAVPYNIKLTDGKITAICVPNSELAK